MALEVAGDGAAETGKGALMGEVSSATSENVGRNFRTTFEVSRLDR